MEETYKPSFILRYFEHAHLPPSVREVAANMAILAAWMDRNVPESAEKSAGLRKLLEAKDCFVRATLP